MITQEQTERIRKSFQEGMLTTRSVAPDGTVEWRQIMRAHRAHVPLETTWKLTTEFGSSVVTGRHGVYVSPMEKVDASSLHVGDEVMCLVNGLLCKKGVVNITKIQTVNIMYDLCISNNHNLFLANTLVLVENSPDRNYHFRPPEQEGEIHQYNRVFGYIWTDYELSRYLQFSLDWFMSLPPSTMNLSSLDQLCAQMPAWKTFILWGAAVHALFALSINWIHDEFSVSGRTIVRLHLNQGFVDVSLEDLYGALHSR